MTQQSSQQVTQQKPVSILKQPSSAPVSAPVSAPSQQLNNNISPDLGYSPGPGQNVTAPKRGRGELVEQQPGMRVPLCGACDGQIRSELSVRFQITEICCGY